MVMLQIINGRIAANHNQKNFEMNLSVFTRLTKVETQIDMMLSARNNPNKKENPEG